MIGGGGFAGVWAAMGAAAELDRHPAPGPVEMTLVSPSTALVIARRL